MLERLWLVVQRQTKVSGFASKVEFNTFRVIRVVRAIRGSVFQGALKTIHEIHETHEKTRSVW